ncbi:MAG: DUF4241 domain-containing protein [Pseudomonadales bacterium]|nr:DUF4241 domain-containing protein [Pseudomonadales bacterium]
MGAERRRFVRVSDIVSLRYRKMDEQELADEKKTVSPHFGSQLLQLDNQFQVVLQRLNDWNANVGEALELLNQKIMVLSEHLSDESEKDTVLAREVSLSACGVGFPAEEKMNLGDHIGLELVLRPIHLRIVTTGRVVGCDPLDDGEDLPYFIRTDLVGVSAEDQESLIQHVIRRESQLLKEQRQRREANDGGSPSAD